LGIFENNSRLLHLSPIDFPLIVMTAVDNISYIFESIDRSKLDSAFTFPLQNDLKTCDMLSTLIPIMFSSDKEFQDKGTLALLNSWIVFPPATVDATPTAPMYTLFYSLSWIFSRIVGKLTNADRVIEF
jgi:hypothetical protein